MHPEYHSKGGAQYKRAGKEPASFRNPYQSHEKQTEDDDQTNWVPSQETSAKAAEGEHLVWVRLRVVWGNFASPPAPNI
jgi:hypothetical protein